MRRSSALAMIAVALALIGLTASSAGAAAMAPTVEHFHLTGDPFTANT